jgi:anaerobic magnesium-protoporphyrin IX monomethyl ester cyclase
MDKADIVLIGYEDEENLGIRSIAAFLALKGIKVRILPCQRTRKEDILEGIRKEDPKIVGFSLIFQRMFFNFANLMAYLRKEGVTAHFTVGGHFPTIEYEGMLRLVPELDSVIRHEGEETMAELFGKLDRPDLWDGIRGLVYRKGGEIRVSPPRPLIPDLDTLPFPLRNDSFETIRGLGVCSILASRGCFYNCSFCSIHRFYQDAPGPKRRTRSPANVVSEMEQLYSRGIRIFNFKDDDLGTTTRDQQSWIENFVGELGRKSFTKDILWRISSRIDEIEKGLFESLVEVGLQTVYLGIESGSEQGLTTANKHYHVDDVYRAIGILDDIGVDYEYGFMLFDPYSTFTTVRENIAMLEYLGRNGRPVIRFTKMFPYVGTTIEKRLVDEGRIKGNIAYPDYEFLDPRLNLLEVFVSQTFHNLIFEADGLGKQLDHLQFDGKILRRFFPDRYDVPAYEKAGIDLTKRCNSSAIETLQKAVDFMEEKTYEEILGSWWLLEALKEQEQFCQEALKREISTIKPVPVAR